VIHWAFLAAGAHHQSPLGGSFGVKTFCTLRGAHRAHGQKTSAAGRLSGPRPHRAFSRQQQPRLGPPHDCELALKRDGTIAGMKMNWSMISAPVRMLAVACC